jgi:hypothetical protein
MDSRNWQGLVSSGFWGTQVSGYHLLPRYTPEFVAHKWPAPPLSLRLTRAERRWPGTNFSMRS